MFKSFATVIHFLNLTLLHRNTMCGKVQCTNVNVNNPPPGATVSIKIVAGKTCVNADFNLGTDVVDPAYVNPGSPCGKGKVSRLSLLMTTERNVTSNANVISLFL